MAPAEAGAPLPGATVADAPGTALAVGVGVSPIAGIVVSAADPDALGEPLADGAVLALDAAGGRTRRVADHRVATGIGDHRADVHLGTAGQGVES